MQRHKLTAAPSIRHLPERNVRRVFFERHEFEAVVAHLPEYLQDAARFAYLVGWRKSEVASLRWDAVDPYAATITLPDSKNSHGRKLVLVGELMDLLKRREQARLIETATRDVRVAEYVFHRNGQPLGDFRKAWHRACVEAGLYHVERDQDGKETKVHEKVFHDFRRTASRNLVRARVRERVAMEVTGHRTRSVFDRYNITSEEDIRQAMQQTTEYVKSLPVTREERGA